MENQSKSLCRLCMQLPGIHNIYEANQVHPALTTAARISWVTQIQMSDSDGLPSQICSDCTTQLDAAFRFIERCLATDRSLRTRSQHVLGEEADSSTSRIADKQEFFDPMPIKTEMEYGEADWDPTGPAPTQVFACSICDGVFKDKRSYISHIRLHTSEPPVFSCDTCARPFNCASHLKRHLRTHTGVKPYACAACPKAFYRHDHLLKHSRSHTGERPFHCSACPRSFSRRDHLSSHEKLHTREKAFGCDMCDRTFFKEGALVRHAKIHEREAAKSMAGC